MPTRAFIPYTPGSGGKHGASQYTDGSDTKLDSVMVLGEQHLPTYVTDDGAVMDTGTINKHLWQLMAGTTLNVYVRRIVLYVNTLAGAATVVSFSLRRLTTAGTGGTAGTNGVLWDGTDGAASTAYMTMPTALGTEGTHLWHERTVVPTAIPAFPGSMKILDWDFSSLRGKAIRIPAGTANGICLKNTVALATATYSGRIIYSEVPY